MNNRTKKILTVASMVLAVIIFIGAGVGVFFYHYSPYNWAIRQINNHYYYDVDIDKNDKNINDVVSTYLDRYSAYYTKSEYKQVTASNSGKKSGVGISYGYVEGKGIYISKVLGNSPADHAGLTRGEYITSAQVEGGEKVTLSSAYDLTKMFAGLDDGVDVTLYSSDASYTVSKQNYTQSYTYLATNSTSWHFTTSADGGLTPTEDITKKMTFLPEGTAYISLSQFYGTAADEFFVLVSKFNDLNCTSLILDLRSNGGGSVSVMCNIAGAFAGGESRDAIVAIDKNGNQTVFKSSTVAAERFRISSNVNVYVLANAGTASASEALMGAMVCYGALKCENIYLSDYSEEYLNWYYGGTNVKTARTYGKGIMQTTYKNPIFGVAIKMTTAKLFWPDETTCIHDDNDGNGGGFTVAMGCNAVSTDWEFTKGDGELKKVVESIGQ